MRYNTLKSEKESTLIIYHQKSIHFRLFMLFENRKKRKWRVEHTVSSSNAVCAWFRHSLCPRLFQLTTFFCLTDILSRQRKIQECSVKKGQLLCQYFFCKEWMWVKYIFSIFLFAMYIHIHAHTQILCTQWETAVLASVPIVFSQMLGEAILRLFY